MRAPSRWVWGLALLASACSYGGTPSPSASSAHAVVPATTVGNSILISGELELPAATAFGEPGFHEVLIASGEARSDLGETSGLRLVVSLRDASRPTQTCSEDHPLSGCATVDWSDDPGRPKVPPGGVFDNSVRVRLQTGPRTFYLSQSGELAGAPDPFVPG